MSENQVYLIKSGDGSFVEETEAIIGISGGKVGIGTTVPEASLHVTGDVKVGGNLSVDGTLTTINSSEITVDDKNIELGSVDNPTNITADGGGLTLRGTTNKTILWNNATDAWEFSEHVRISDGMQFQGDELRARDTDGLYLGDSAGSGIFIQQGGDVLIAANLFVKGSNVSSDIDVISGDLDTLESVVDSATGDIDTISGVVSGLLSAEVDDDTAFESLSGSVDVISGDLDALEAVVDSATGDIDVLSGVVDGILSNDQLGKWIENESEAGEIYYNQGNVGIATTNPSSELDVVGTIKSTNAQFSNSLTLGGNPVLTGTVEDLGKWSEDTANNIYYYGNVGIGTSVPSPEKLHVQGDVYAGTIDSSKISVGDEFVVESNGVIGGGTPTNGEVLMWNGATWAPAANNPGGLLTGEIPKSFIQQMSVGSSVHAVEFSQELGGIPAVCTQLEIQGDGEIIPYVLSGVSETGFHVVFAKEIPSLGYRLHTSFGGKDVYWETGVNSIYFDRGDVLLSDNLIVSGNLNVSGPQGIKINGNDVLTGTIDDLGKWEDDAAIDGNIYYNAGSVGIGTESPNNSYDLDVNGIAYVDDIRFNSVGGTSAGATNDIIKWDGSAWIAASPDTLGIGGSSSSTEVPNSFVSNIPQGTESFAINWTSSIGTLDNVPRIAASLEINGEGEIIPYTTSGISETGYHVIFSEPVPTTNYRIHTVFGGKDVHWELGTDDLQYNDRNVSIQRNLTVGGDLTINGNTTTINTQTLEVEDNNIVIAKNLASSSLSDAGITWGNDDTVKLGFTSSQGFAFSGGNVGIGTTSPQKTLHISANSHHFVLEDTNAEAGKKMRGISNNNNSLSIGRYSDDFNAFTPDLTISNQGNVGIGTTDPQVALDVNGDSNTQLRLTASDSLGASMINFGDADNQAVGRIVYSHINDSLSFKTNNVNHRLYIDASGNVGIGTTSPNAKLEIKRGKNGFPNPDISEDDVTALRVRGNDNAVIDMGVNGGSGTWIQARNRTLDSTQYHLALNPLGGNVGIGTTNPGAKLHVDENDSVPLYINRRTSEGDLLQFRKDGSAVGSIGVDFGDNLTIDAGSGESGLNFATSQLAPYRGGANADAAIDLGLSSVRWRDLYLSGKTHYGVSGQTYYQVVKSNGDGLYLGADEGNTGGNGADIRFNVKADEKMRITSEGNVGIGTTDPGAPLHIKTSNTTDTLLLESTGDSNLNAPDLILYRNSATPADADNLGIIKFRGVNDGTIGVNRSDIDYALIQSEITDASNNAEKGSLSFWTRGVGGVNKRMTIDSNGNVGIGTTSPDATLHIKASDDSENALALWVVNKAHNNSIITAYENGNVKLGSFCYDDASGSVGIGTTSPDSALHVMQSGDVNDGITLQQVNYAKKLNLRTNSAGELIVDVDDGTVEAMRIKSDGNVGIGTTNPGAKLHVGSAKTSAFDYLAAFDSTSSAKFRIGDESTVSQNRVILSNNYIRSSSGYTADDSEYGLTHLLFGDGEIRFATAGAGNNFPTDRVIIDSAGNVLPGTDDTQDIGSATKRWDDIYATNGTIQTSDRELKQDIEELSEAETRVAQACKGLLRKYRWKSSVAEKGDDARIHFGIMAQDLEDAFAAEGLDAGRYGMFIKNTWWEADRVIPAVEAVEAVEAVYDEEGNEVSPAVEAVEAQPERTELDIFNNIEDAPEGATEVTQRGVRYAELLAFIIATI